MSALNADPAGPSRYLRSKGEAEAIVKASGLRLDDLPAQRDLRTARMPSSTCSRASRRLFPVIALAAPDARFAARLRRRCRRTAWRARSTTSRRTTSSYDLCGPRIYTLRELVTLCRRSERRGASDPPARAAAVEAAGHGARNAAGKADEPRQPAVDGEGQRVRLPVSGRVRRDAGGAGGDRARIPCAGRDAQSLRPAIAPAADARTLEA